MRTLNASTRSRRAAAEQNLIECLEQRALFSTGPAGDAAHDVGIAATAPLVLGQKVSGEVSAPGEVDEYTFTAAEGQRVFLDVQKATGTFATLYLDFTLYRLPTGSAPVRVWATTAYAGQPDIADHDVTQLSAGNYKITVDSRYDDPSTYEFTLLPVAPPEVRRINIGDEVSGAIEAVGNVDEYNFTAAPGQRIFLDVLETTGTYATLYLDFTLVPLNGGTPGAPVFRSTAYATVPNNGDAGPFTLAGGEYRLTVDARLDDLSTYRFKLVNVPPVDTRPITFGTVSNGAIESAGAIDEWTFTVPAGGQRAYLDVQQVTGNRPTLYLDFQLLRTDGTAPQEKFKTTAFVDQHDLADAGPVALDPGTYKLAVSARGMDTAGYRFVLRRDAEITASGTAWSAAFLQALQAAGLGDGSGYRNNSLDTPKTIPWNNVNRLVVQLPAGLTLQASDVVARGVNGTYTPAEFSYDSPSGRATVRFAEPLPYDTYYVDVAGGFRTKMRVLPGDATRDGRDNSLDLSFVKQRLNRSIAAPGTGNGAYNVLADLNGDARINAIDLAIVKTNLNRLLPAALAPAAAGGATDEILTGAYDDGRI